MPIAVLAGGAIYNVHTDQLNTPRLLTAAVGGTTAWAWDPEPFGNTQPTGTFTYNHRFPGQYYDRETGLHHNGFRDYHPTTGRYIESDPLGLAAGLNTYVYADNNPLSVFDPDGLEPGKGERGRTRRPDGTPTPDKHWRDDPDRPGWGWQKDPQTGKGIHKKRPPYIPPPPPKDKPKADSEMCGNTCKTIGAAVVGGACIIACVLQPELCIPALRAAAAAQ